jgi:hypothetical protein
MCTNLTSGTWTFNGAFGGAISVNYNQIMISDTGNTSSWRVKPLVTGSPYLNNDIFKDTVPFTTGYYQSLLITQFLQFKCSIFRLYW